MGSTPTFGTILILGNSLKVERLILDQVVGVRIPVPQPTSLCVFLIPPSLPALHVLLITERHSVASVQAATLAGFVSVCTICPARLGSIRRG